eukprot:g47891.t1
MDNSSSLKIGRSQQHACISVPLRSPELMPSNFKRLAGKAVPGRTKDLSTIPHHDHPEPQEPEHPKFKQPKKEHSDKWYLREAVDNINEAIERLERKLEEHWLVAPTHKLPPLPQPKLSNPIDLTKAEQLTNEALALIWTIGYDTYIRYEAEIFEVQDGLAAIHNGQGLILYGLLELMGYHMSAGSLYLSFPHPEGFFFEPNATLAIAEGLLPVASTDTNHELIKTLEQGKRYANTYVQDKVVHPEIDKELYGQKKWSQDTDKQKNNLKLLKTLKNSVPRGAHIQKKAV